MNRNIILGLAVLLCFFSFSQNKILEIPIQYKGFSYKNKESLAISNEKTGELMLLIEDADKTKAILVSPEMKIVSEFEFESLPYSFKKFIGHQIDSDGSFSILFTNNSNKKFGVLKLNFEKKMSFRVILDFKLKKEVYVESVSHKNKYYLISTSKSSNNVHFYEYNDGRFSKKATHSFEFFETNSSNEHSDFLDNGVIKIDNTIPNGIETTSKSSKLYILDNNFVFTFDDNENETQIATISMDGYEMNLDAFSKPNIDTDNLLKNDNSYLYDNKIFQIKATPDLLNLDAFSEPNIDTDNLLENHNSYLYDNKIFQIKVTPDLLKFVVKDFESKTVLKKITLKKEDSITFKNTPIIQVGGEFGGTRELEKTSKFLRKVSKGDIGISVHKQNNLYKITLGSEIIMYRGSGMTMGGFGGMPMGGFGGMPIGGVPLGGVFVSLSFNPTFCAYHYYSSTKTTHIDCLFDNSFNHVKGDVPDNVFDRIDDYENSFKKENVVKPNVPSSNKGYQRFKSNSNTIKPKLINVFSHNDKLYFSYLNTKNKNYYLAEFLK